MATIRLTSRRSFARGLTRPSASLVAVLGAVAALVGSGAGAETEPKCADNSLPIETLGSDEVERQALYAQAKACVDGGKPQLAVALLTQIIKSDPTDATAYLNRGSALARTGEVALALSDFGVAIGLKPDLVEAWYDRGTMFTHMRRF
jgi:tetratricopeptide (TPR) repeat protein